MSSPLSVVRLSCDNPIFGNLSIDGTVEADLFCLEDRMSIPDDGKITLYSTDGEIHTLFNCIEKSSSGLFPGFRVGYPQKFHSSKLSATHVFSGPVEWQDDFEISSAHFRLPELSKLALQPHTTSKLNKPFDEVTDADLQIASTAASGASVSIRIDGTWSSGWTEPRELNAGLVIEFGEPVSWNVARKTIIRLANLYSLSFGRTCKPSEISVRTENYMIRLTKLVAEPAQFRVSERRPERAPSRDLRIVETFFSFKGRSGISTFEEAVQNWMALSDDWHEVFGLFLECFADEQRYTRARVLAAFILIDKLPPMSPKPDLSGEIVVKLAESAKRQANEMGLAGYDERIDGLFENLKVETFSQRCQRLADEYLIPTIGEEQTRELVKYLKFFRKRRGAAAHEHSVTGRNFDPDVAVFELSCAELAAFIVFSTHVLSRPPRLDEIEFNRLYQTFKQVGARLRLDGMAKTYPD